MQNGSASSQGKKKSEIKGSTSDHNKTSKYQFSSTNNRGVTNSSMKQENNSYFTHLSTNSLASFRLAVVSSSTFDKNIITCQNVIQHQLNPQASQQAHIHKCRSERTCILNDNRQNRERKSSCQINHSLSTGINSLILVDKI